MAYISIAYQQIKKFPPSRCVGCSAKQTLSIQHIKKAKHSGNNLFLKDQFLNIYAHTEKIQGTFPMNYISKDRAACC